MKKLFYFIFIALAAVAVSCSSTDENEYVIKGTTSLDRLNGHRVFVVPYGGGREFEDSIGVDSVVIENNSFEFRSKKGEYLARITVEMKVRYGVQELLVVTEPGGVINVVLDSVSSGTGTPQNDVLQTWKEKKIAHDALVFDKRMHIQSLLEAGDSVAAGVERDSLRAFNENFRLEMVDLANTLGKGTAYDLLIKRYGE